MRVAMVSCLAYRDAWEPFRLLFEKFWPGQTFSVVSDVANPGMSWCRVVADFARFETEPILLMQEDFFLNAPVNEVLIDMARLLALKDSVGAVRLYPCPGATDISIDPYYAPVARHTPYRNSCQATIWDPRYLWEIASRFETPFDFEVHGSAWASLNLPQEVLAFKREVQPWPISYYCSAISRGKWEPAALEFCRANGIEVDVSMRAIAS